MTTWRALVLLCAVVLLAGSCSQPETDQQKLNSVMVGSDVVLPTADTDAISEIGVELGSLAAPLARWWSGLNDPQTSTATWLAQAPSLLTQMRDVVDRIDSELTPERDPHVRDTFSPYVVRWRDLLRALEQLRDRVAAGDEPGQQRAVDDYNDVLAAIRALDAARVTRVVDVLGKDAARDLLENEGVDRGRFGLGD
jgi:hypothetical protein